MTQEQIKEQLKRLNVFGNIKTPEELQEYLIVLQRFSYNDLLSGVNFLIANYDKRGFPLPAEIIKSCTQSAFNFEEKKEKVLTGCGGFDANVEFWITWHMVEKVNEKRWKYYYEERLGQSPRDEGKIAIEYYRGIQDEINAELGIKKTVVVEKEEDDFQF